jgi:serine/threonine protein kinase
MLVGQPPFYSKYNKERLFKCIKMSNIKYPNFLSERAVKFLSQVLVKDVSQRLGTKSVNEVKEHIFFQDVKWDLLLQKKLKPPFIPVLQSQFDTKYIDSEFLDVIPADSFNASDEVGSKDELFNGFSFNNLKERQ